MTDLPRISIVTPSFNQGRYIAETILSVVAQSYPNLEHIVIDGGSTDDTLDILARFPHLRVVSEKDRGHADALNKGFALATGSIWGFLNSDDTLLPGALVRVAQEIDPRRGRHIVMGRCRFTDELGRFTGIEHPSYFESHQRVLEVWKRHTIPQPTVFWTPEVWRNCGPASLGQVHVDYDLFCRFSARYRFYFIDQVLATYRLHPESTTSGWSEAARLEDSIRISRQYWGSPLSPSYWQLASSLALYRLDRVGRTSRWLSQARTLKRNGRSLPAILLAAASTLLAPEVSFYTVVYPAARMRASGRAGSLLAYLARHGGIAPQTAVYLEHTHLWEDRWAGPRLIQTMHTTEVTNDLVVAGRFELAYLSRSPVLKVCVEGRLMAEQVIQGSGDFELVVRLEAPLQPGEHTIEIDSSEWHVPHRFNLSDDYRPLAWRLQQLELRP